MTGRIGFQGAGVHTPTDLANTGTRTKHLTPAEQDMVVRLVTAGTSPNEVALQFGINVSSVRYLVRRRTA